MPLVVVLAAAAGCGGTDDKRQPRTSARELGQLSASQQLACLRDETGTDAGDASRPGEPVPDDVLVWTDTLQVHVSATPKQALVFNFSFTEPAPTVEMYQFDDTGDARRVLTELDERVDEAGKTEGGDVVYDFFRADSRVIVVWGSAPPTREQTAILYSCLGYDDPAVQRTRAPISGGTDTAALTACFAELVAPAGKVVDWAAQPAQDNGLTTYLAAQQPDAEPSNPQASFTAVLEGGTPGKPPAKAVDVYVLDSDLAAEDAFYRIEQPSALDENPLLKASQAEGRLLALVWGTRQLTESEATQVQRCLRA
jgi:hypothetical protein